MGLLAKLAMCALTLVAFTIVTLIPFTWSQDDHTYLNGTMSLAELVDLAIEQAKEELAQDNVRSLKSLNRANGQTRAFTRQYVKFSSLTEEIGESSNVHINAYQILLSYGVAPYDALEQLYHKRPAFCRDPIMRCDRTRKYRTSNGTCNNVNNPLWGSSFYAFNRIVPAYYDDMFNSPNGGDGKKAPSTLPNPRLVSTTVHPDLIKADPKVTNMLPQFGQFVDHDITLTPEGDKRCCKGESHLDCFKIGVRQDDPFYSKLLEPQTCLDFTRSTAYCFPTPTGIREQMNILTAYLDASNVYGSEQELVNILREFSRGRLRVNKNNPNFLPTKTEIEQLNPGKHIEFVGTFVAGDVRVNEMPALAAMHNLFLREHNRIAAEIYARRSTWSDEQIFQESRRILTAEWQNIVYSEYLTVLLGSEVMNRMQMTLTDNYSFYDASVDATIFHSFATAAYRFGHTFLNGIFKLVQGLTEISSYRIRDNFFVSNQLTQNGGKGYDWILGGLQTQNAQTFDPFVTEDFTNFVLRLPTEEFGQDLIARNIQRGRDHGLQPWQTYRRVCGLPTADTWADKPADVRQDSWDKLKTLYRSPEDIELFTGGLIEYPPTGALTGATFNCLKAEQFSRLKKGDRFFFTHQNQAGSFSLTQMRNIRRRTLGDIMCENSGLDMTTANVFLIPSPTNPWIPCNSTTRTKLAFDLLVV